MLFTAYFLIKKLFLHPEFLMDFFIAIILCFSFRMCLFFNEMSCFALISEYQKYPYIKATFYILKFYFCHQASIRDCSQGQCFSALICGLTLRFILSLSPGFNPFLLS